MSQFTFLASDVPLDNMENPHVKRLSINEAIALGIEPPDMLPADFDRDKPGVMLWVDDEANLGDISIFEAKWYKTYTPGLEYNSIIEWDFTAERAQRLISYIHKHLETAARLELWHVWLDSDNEIMGNPEEVIVAISELTTDVLAKHMKDNRGADRPVRMIFIGNVIQVREIIPADYQALEDFLYHAIFVPPGVEAPPRDIIHHPDVFIYIDGFGSKSGDMGVVAEADGRIVGAAWERIIPAFGHVDDKTPELAISVLPEYRGRGVGAAMMARLFELLRESGYRQTSLAVQKMNAAVRFYQRLGYETVRESVEEFIMVKDLRDTRAEADSATFAQ